MQWKRIKAMTNIRKKMVSTVFVQFKLLSDALLFTLCCQIKVSLKQFANYVPHVISLSKTNYQLLINRRSNATLEGKIQNYIPLGNDNNNDEAISGLLWSMASSLIGLIRETCRSHPPFHSTTSHVPEIYDFNSSDKLRLHTLPN